MPPRQLVAFRSSVLVSVAAYGCLQAATVMIAPRTAKPAGLPGRGGYCRA